MLRAILNKSWQRHPTRHQLYGHLPPITKTIQVRRTRHAGHCWRSRDELIRDVLLWIPTYGREKAGRPARTYIQQLCEDTGSCPEDLPRAMNDREKWRERVRDIRATSTIWYDIYIIQPIDKRLISFPKLFFPEENVIVRSEFELARYDITTHHVNHFAIGLPFWSYQVDVWLVCHVLERYFFLFSSISKSPINDKKKKIS